ncbi:MAG: DUF4230 domain-containing protein [Verrucomicrobiota bacterium]
MSDEEPVKRGGSRVWAFFGGLSLLLAVAGLVWYFVMVRPAAEAAGGTLDRVERFFGELLGPQAKISRTESSSVLRVSEVGELALLEYEIKVSKEVEDEQVALQVLTSKKRLRMEGTFRVKVGYDITSGVSVFYDEEGRATLTGLGGAQVLTAEMVQVKTLEDTSGFWNKVSERDRDALTNELRLQAIRDVKESGLLEQMDGLMRQQMKGLLGVEDLRVEEELVVP